MKKLLKSTVWCFKTQSLAQRLLFNIYMIYKSLYISIIYTHIHIYLYLYKERICVVCAYVVSTHLCACGCGQQSQYQASYSMTSYLTFLRQGLSQKLELTDLAQLAGQWAPEMLLSSLLCSRITDVWCCVWLFRGHWRSELRSPCLHGKHYIHCVLSPALLENLFPGLIYELNFIIQEMSENQHT